jgi:hypothetical protein
MKKTIFNFTETTFFKLTHLITFWINVGLLLLSLASVISGSIFPIWLIFAVIVFTLQSYNEFILAKQELAKGNLDINYWSISNFHILLIITPLVFIINVVGLFL